MRLGIIADAHLGPAGSPSVLGFPPVPVEYAMDDVMRRYRLALRRCVEEDVDGIVLLGDLSQSGDGESLEAGVRLAARTGRTVWAVSGNHDCGGGRVDALARAVRWVGAENVRLAALGGEMAGGGPRIAGMCVASENRGYTARSGGEPDVYGWRKDLVVWLTHYPAISFAEEASRVGLHYGDNDLEDIEEAARPLLERPAPTVVVSGHMHMRYACVAGEVLQISCAALVEPPYEITLLDIEREGGIKVRKESVPVIQSPENARLPILSPSRQEWIFESETWRPVEPAKPGKKATK